MFLCAIKRLQQIAGSGGSWELHGRPGEATHEQVPVLEMARSSHGSDTVEEDGNLVPLGAPLAVV